MYCCIRQRQETKPIHDIAGCVYIRACVCVFVSVCVCVCGVCVDVRTYVRVCVLVSGGVRLGLYAKVSVVRIQDPRRPR